MSELVTYLIIAEGFRLHNDAGEDFVKGDTVELSQADAAAFLADGLIEPGGKTLPSLDDDSIEDHPVVVELKEKLASLEEELSSYKTAYESACFENTDNNSPLFEHERHTLLMSAIASAEDDDFKQDGLLKKAYLNEQVSFANSVTDEEQRAAIEAVSNSVDVSEVSK